MFLDLVCPLGALIGSPTGQPPPKKKHRVPLTPSPKLQASHPFECLFPIIASPPDARGASQFPLAKSKRGRDSGAEGSPPLTTTL